MTEQQQENCDKCGTLCITSDENLSGPLEGRYEYPAVVAESKRRQSTTH